MIKVGEAAKAKLLPKIAGCMYSNSISIFCFSNSESNPNQQLTISMLVALCNALCVLNSASACTTSMSSGTCSCSDSRDWIHGWFRASMAVRRLFGSLSNRPKMRALPERMMNLTD